VGRGEVGGEIAEKIAGDETVPLGVLSQVQDDGGKWDNQKQTGATFDFKQ